MPILWHYFLMNLLLLPGNSKRNKEWLSRVEKAVSSSFDLTHTHSYMHWDAKESDIDLAHEAKRLSKEIQGFEPYAVFAKSVGSILTCMATAKGILLPQACLFAGFPLAMVVKHKLPVDGWLLTTEFPIFVAQNNTDPLGSYLEVRDYFRQVGRKHVTLFKLRGDSHDYEDFSSLKKLSTKLH
jgi:hypothetical protein